MSDDEYEAYQAYEEEQSYEEERERDRDISSHHSSRRSSVSHRSSSHHSDSERSHRSDDYRREEREEEYVRAQEEEQGGGMGGAAAALAGLSLGGSGGGGGYGNRTADQGYGGGFGGPGHTQGYHNQTYPEQGGGYGAYNPYGNEAGYNQASGGYMQQGGQAYQGGYQGGLQGDYDRPYGNDNRGQGEYPQQYGNQHQDQYGLPPAGPPPGNYQPTGAGFVPSVGGYVAQQPPYGNQTDRPAPPPQQGGPYFEYSTCSGRRKALLIGINYFGTKGELAGCINDVHNVQRFIKDRFGYQPEDMVLLTDDTNDPRSLPTRANIIKAMQWLVEGVQKNDALFFHYSGHGTQTEDLNGDEGDDDDEAICPLDYEEAGLIIDDDSERMLEETTDNHNDLLVQPLPAGCRLTAIFDSCHSGTVMDLPYVYSTEGKIKEPNLFEGAQDDLVAAGVSAIQGDSGGLFKGLMSIAKGAFEAKKADAKGKKNNTSPADVIQWAGCKDSQTSADTEEEGKATGAMSYAFIAALTRYPQQSYQQLLVSIREEMRGKYTQKPQLSACHPIDTELMFVA